MVAPRGISASAAGANRKENRMTGARLFRKFMLPIVFNNSTRWGEPGNDQTSPGTGNETIAEKF